MKRLFFYIFFISLSSYCMSVLAQDSISVSVESFHIKGGTKGTDHWYGFKDSLIATRQVIMLHNIYAGKPTMDSDQTEFHVFDSCVVYRTYKKVDKIAVLSGDYIKDNTIIYNDSVDAVLGENDKIEYIVNLFYDTYTRESSDQEWQRSSSGTKTIITETCHFSVFEKPIVEEINLKNFVYKHGDEINLKINVSGGCNSGWVYKWYSSQNKDDELSRGHSLDFTCNNNGTELHKEILYCDIINYAVGEKGQVKLFSETRELNSPIEIYPAPRFAPQNIHHNINATTSLYSLYIGQELDLEALKGKSGGSGGYPEGWKYELLVNGNLVENFKPSKTGNYELEYKVSNIATQTDKTQTTWFEESFKYTFEVFEEPDIAETLHYSEKGNNPEIFDEKEDLHVVKGTEIQVSLEGLGGCKDSWNFDCNVYSGKKQIYLTDTNLENNRFTAKFRTEENLSKDTIHYLIKYKIYNNPLNHVKTGTGENSPFIMEGEKKIVVWRDVNTIVPDLKISGNDTIYIESYDNVTVSLAIDNVGGAPNRWKNTWKPQKESPMGTVSNNGEKYELSNLLSYNGKPSTYSYKVVSEFGAHSDTYNFVVVVWPKPVLKNVLLKLNKDDVNISYNINDNKIAPRCYKDDQFMLEYTIEGGIMAENRNVWKCIVTDDKKSTTVHNLEEKSGKISLKAADLTVKFVHEYDGLYNSVNDYWLSNSNEYVIEPNIHEQPKFDEAFTDSSTVAKWGMHTIDVYEGQPINMKYVLKEGYDNGWKLSWKVDEILYEGTEDQWIYTPQLATGTKPYEEKKIMVTIENSIDENVGLYEVKEYPLRVWRKANFKDPIITVQNNPVNAISDETINVRVGNGLRLNVASIENGYIDLNSYIYSWDINGNIQKGNDVTTLIKMKENSPEFSCEPQTIKFNAQVIGPYGNVWDSNEKAYNVNVYNKPKTPTKLYKKGSGKSGTLICETELTDKELTEYKYYLVYGYVDTNGQDVDFASVEQKNPGTVRWALTPSNDVLKKDRLYVYALWKDGMVEVTSGKRYIAGVDDDWDGSTYNGSTRAVLNNIHTKIEDIASEKLDGVEIVQIYSLDGVAAGKNVKALSSGIYIVNYMSNGNEVKSRKIIIK